jgi:hypothetical protein
VRRSYLHDDGRVAALAGATRDVEPGLLAALARHWCLARGVRWHRLGGLAGRQLDRDGCAEVVDSKGHCKGGEEHMYAGDHRITCKGGRTAASCMQNDITEGAGSPVVPLGHERSSRMDVMPVFPCAGAAHDGRRERRALAVLLRAALGNYAILPPVPTRATAGVGVGAPRRLLQCHAAIRTHLAVKVAARQQQGRRDECVGHTVVA